MTESTIFDSLTAHSPVEIEREIDRLTREAAAFRANEADARESAEKAEGGVEVLQRLLALIGREPDRSQPRRRRRGNTRDLVLEVLRQPGFEDTWWDTGEVYDALVERGHDITRNLVRVTLKRMAEAEQLVHDQSDDTFILPEYYSD